MIQRIQTIWLILITILLIVVIFIVNAHFTLFKTLFIIGNGLIAVISIIAILLYKNRLLQIKICYFILVLLLLSFFTLLLSLRWATIFPTIAILGDICAIQAIKKDEKMVRSLNRLR